MRGRREQAMVAAYAYRTRSIEEISKKKMVQETGRTMRSQQRTMETWKMTSAREDALISRQLWRLVACNM